MYHIANHCDHEGDENVIKLMTFDNHVVGLGKLEWEMFPSLRIHHLNLIGEAMKNNGN
jgi:hypothetical protein